MPLGASRVSLFAASVVGFEASGGTESSSGGYKIHTFNSTADFIVASAPAGSTVDVLVIAGGGGGGGTWQSKGGGGAGGMRAITSQSVTAQTYACTVGSGGAYTADGVDSSFGGVIDATGGGKGGGSGSGVAARNGQPGGSGSGPMGWDYGDSQGLPGAGNAGSYDPVEGYNGGTNPAPTAGYGGAGGGGAGGVGGNSISNLYTYAPSGIGASNSFSGGAVTYATGGKGGAWHWQGSNTQTANSGDGGDGTSPSGGAGGSGVVIIRYPE